MKMRHARRRASSAGKWPGQLMTSGGEWPQAMGSARIPHGRLFRDSDSHPPFRRPDVDGSQSRRGDVRANHHRPSRTSRPARHHQTRRAPRLVLGPWGILGEPIACGHSRPLGIKLRGDIASKFPPQVRPHRRHTGIPAKKPLHANTVGQTASLDLIGRLSTGLSAPPCGAIRSGAASLIDGTLPPNPSYTLTITGVANASNGDHITSSVRESASWLLLTCGSVLFAITRKFTTCANFV